MSLDPFNDDDLTTKMHTYKGSIVMDKKDEEMVDARIAYLVKQAIKDRPKEIKNYMKKYLVPKLDTIYKASTFYDASMTEKENSGMDIYDVMKWCAYISKNHQFGKYGPKVMIKYIEPIIDTRDNTVFAIRFRDISWDKEIIDIIPKEWLKKHCDADYIYIRDCMNDGFLNLNQRLVTLIYLIEGELEK